MAVLAAAAQPSWLWYATRGLGAASLVLLTITVSIGIGTARRWSSSSTPGFVVAALHRNVSLLSVLVVGGHVITTLLDPFAGITVRDAVVPGGASYRPVWLGLGVASTEVLVAVVVTSLARHRLGLRLWRLVHWAAYASWPMAVAHTLGTGSDAQAPWLIALCFACLVAVLMAAGERVMSGRPGTVPVRLVAGLTGLLVVYAGAAWVFAGPLQPGWAARAGTPAALLTQRRPDHSKVAFSDPLSGVLVRGMSGQTVISFRDTVDTALTVGVRSPGPTESLPVVTIARGGRVLCTAPASAGSVLYAVCGSTRLTITVEGPSGPGIGTQTVSGRLATSGPLA